ncbi:MAG: cation diffusion facilitator family transporter [Candidatus Moraniibacteriota bacterium]
MKEKIALLSILVNALLAGVKIAVGFLVNSASVLASGVDSLSDVVSSTIGYFGIRMSQKPADEEHPYGHHKFEVLSGFVITLIIALSGFVIIYESIKKFFDPQTVSFGNLALIIMIFSALINEGMARVKKYYGKKENSIGLLSDGAHSRIDVFTSIAVVAGLLLNNFWVYADASVACLLGFYVIREAFSIGKEATDSLLDTSAGEEAEKKIKDLVQSEGIDLQSLKTQKKGAIITANLEIGLSRDLRVEEAMKISSNLKSKLIEKIDNLRYVSIQISSHEMEDSFFKSSFGRGFGWQGRTDGNKKSPGFKEGKCICKKCGYAAPHQRGVPCSVSICPNCKTKLEREIL